jgi:S-adenosylmethionine:tRNA ribosyltransferase-isomerase
MRLPRKEGAPTDHVFRDLPGLLRPGDLLVVNRSRVFPARLLGRREGGGGAEVFLLRDLGDDRWEALVRPGRRLRPGAAVAIDPGLTVVIETAAVGPEGRRVVRLRAERGSVEAALERAGHVPLPPYIRRPDRPEDRARYQTVYAREKGSVAAPTAGLHFTPSLLDALRAAGVGIAEIVLHVGPGTFRPVTAEEVEDHRLEPEPYVVPAETADAITSARTSGGRVVAVGTTVVRALETVATVDGTVRPGAGWTELVVTPARGVRAVDAILTGLHAPRASHLAMLEAIAGREHLARAYAAALRHRYLWHEFGDLHLILPRRRRLRAG